jgi:hypothetical protein
MIPLMESAETTDVILHRISNVGPITRYILSGSACSRRLRRRTAAIQRITKDPLLLEEYLDSNGMKGAQYSGPTNEFFPETIFITTGTRNKAYAKVSDSASSVHCGQEPECTDDDDRKFPAKSSATLIDASNHEAAGLQKHSQYDFDHDNEEQGTDYKALQIVPVCSRIKQQSDCTDDDDRKCAAKSSAGPQKRLSMILIKTVKGRILTTKRCRLFRFVKLL